MATRRKTTRSRKASVKSKRKTTSKRVTTREAVAAGNSQSAFSAVDTNTVSRIKKRPLVIAVVVLLGLLVYQGRSLFIVSIVNGKPIYRISVIRQLERLGGSQIYDELLRRELVDQELANKGITVSDDEINEEINQFREDIKAQGLTLEEALAQDNLTVDDLFALTKFQKSVTALVESGVEVTDEEISSAFEKNKEFFGEQTLEEVTDQIRDSLLQEKIQTESQAYIAGLQEEANIINFLEY